MGPPPYKEQAHQSEPSMEATQITNKMDTAIIHDLAFALHEKQPSKKSSRTVVIAQSEQVQQKLKDNKTTLDTADIRKLALALDVIQEEEEEIFFNQPEDPIKQFKIEDEQEYFDHPKSRKYRKYEKKWYQLKRAERIKTRKDGYSKVTKPMIN